MAENEDRDFIEAVEELYREWLEFSKKDDPSLRGLPDFEAACRSFRNRHLTNAMHSDGENCGKNVPEEIYTKTGMAKRTF